MAMRGISHLASIMKSSLLHADDRHESSFQSDGFHSLQYAYTVDEQSSCQMDNPEVAYITRNVAQNQNHLAACHMKLHHGQA